MAARAGVYLRISQDRTGLGAGVDRQRQDCDSLIADRGWTKVSEYIDNDVSAYDRNKQRPEWQRLLVDAARGDIDIIVAWHADRLYRQVRDLPSVIDLVEQHGTTIATVKSGEFDLSTATGRMVATILVSIAEQESAQKSERLIAQRLQAATQGKPSGGPRVFGYEKDWTVCAEEAEIVREVAERLLSGDSLRAVTFDLHDREVPTARGGTWRTSTVKQMITAARFAGLREHTPGGKGATRHRGRGMGPVVATGDWPPILTVDQMQRLRALFGQRGATATRLSKRLLSGGLVVCGKCGSNLNSRTVPGGPERWRYACIRLPGRQASHCGGISVSGRPLDELVTDQVLDLLAEPQNRPQPPSAAHGLEEALGKAEIIQSRMRTLTAEYASGRIDDETYNVARESADRTIRELNLESFGTVVSPLDGFPSTKMDIRELWGGLHLDRRRAVLRAVLRVVVVNPALDHSPRLNPDRVKLKWRV